MERAKNSMAAGRLSLAMAHTQLILHNEGLQVFIDVSGASESLRESCRKAGQRAIRYWNETLGSGPLVEVDKAESAQVRIAFQKDVFLNGKTVGGSCSQSRLVVTRGEKSTPDYSAHIKARYRMPDGIALNADSLTNIVIHELGHVYGLEDCHDKSHLMSELDPSKPKTALHPDEQAALKQMRQTFFDVQRDIFKKARQKIGIRRIGHSSKDRMRLTWTSLRDPQSASQNC